MLEGTVLLMLVGYVALYIFLSVGIGAIQAAITVHVAELLKSG